MQLESCFYLRNTLLHDADTNCMANSVEVRVPMLNRRVLDVACALPGHLLLPRMRADKHLLRLAFASLLRPAVTDHPKNCFAIPIDRWMTGPLREVCEHALVVLKAQGLLRVKAIDAVWRSFLADPEGWMWLRPFTLCVLGMYLEHQVHHSR
jgi:asparagine synthase (glutamine-hydrolysing)